MKRLICAALFFLLGVTGQAIAITAPVPIVSTWASSYHDGFPPENVLDTDLATRWSAEGDGEWIVLELDDNEYDVASVEIAFAFGDQRRYRFDLEISSSGLNWIPVGSFESSGATLEIEIFPQDVTNDTDYGFVRIIGRGSNVNQWNNITRVVIHGFNDILFADTPFIQAIANDGRRLDDLTLDNPWQAKAGDFVEIEEDARCVYIHLEPGEPYQYEVESFGLGTSGVVAGDHHTPSVRGLALGGALITFLRPAIVYEILPIDVCDPVLFTDIISISAGGHTNGHQPAHVLDSDRNTRWSAEGSDASITFHIGTEPRVVHGVDIHWFRSTERRSQFSIEASFDGVTWLRVFEGRSRITGLMQRVWIPQDRRPAARYIRIVGDGNDENPFTSINEVGIVASVQRLLYDLLPEAADDLFAVGMAR